MVDLSICIATLNACDYLRSCLQIIFDQSSYLRSMELISAGPLPSPDQPASDLNKLSFEMIIVDNGSSDGTIAMLQREYPGINLILNGRNDGFAKPVNQASPCQFG